VIFCLEPKLWDQVNKVLGQKNKKGISNKNPEGFGAVRSRRKKNWTGRGGKRDGFRVYICTGK